MPSENVIISLRNAPATGNEKSSDDVTHWIQTVEKISAMTLIYLSFCVICTFLAERFT